MEEREQHVLLQRIEEWRRKSHQEENPFDSYMSIFIAYNIFYSLYWNTRYSSRAQNRGDQRKALATTALLNGSDQLFQRIQPALENYLRIIPIYRREYWPHSRALNRVSISEELELAIQAGDAKRTVEMLLKWLYKVRCNLVHGEKDYDDLGQERLLDASAHLLDRILEHFLVAYRQEYVD